MTEPWSTARRLPIGDHADQYSACLLYTSDAADERSSVDLGGRRIIKKKTRCAVREHDDRDSNDEM